RTLVTSSAPPRPTSPAPTYPRSRRTALSTRTASTPAPPRRARGSPRDSRHASAFKSALTTSSASSPQVPDKFGSTSALNPAALRKGRHVGTARPRRRAERRLRAVLVFLRRGRGRALPCNGRRQQPRAARLHRRIAQDAGTADRAADEHTD